MTHLREAAQQALEAMRCGVPTGKITLYAWDKAVSALRAALAQQGRPHNPPPTVPSAGAGTTSAPWQKSNGSASMTDLRTAAQQAYEALWYYHATEFGRDTPAGKAIAAFHAALAQQAEPVEPVGAVLVNRESREGVMFYSADMIPDSETLKDRFELVKVYTAPPLRVPLTEEEILGGLRLAPLDPSLWHLKDEAVVGDLQRAVLAIARAVEAAHGIGRQSDLQIEDRLARHGIPKP